jgi:hypothetical protein
MTEATRSSTYPTIAAYTPAVLDCLCKSHGMSRNEYRLAILKRVEADLDAYLKEPITELHPDERETLEESHRLLRSAIGEE